MKRKITFYNHYHNGDIFVSKGFIYALTSQLPDFKFSYCHSNKEKTTRDIISYGGQPSQYDRLTRFVDADKNELAINTWIGVYIPDNHPQPPHFWNGGINYIALHNMWRHIYTKIENHFGIKLKFSNIPEDYISTIDYSAYDLLPIKSHLIGREEKKRVLFSNGMPLSGQSFADDMSNFINFFAKYYPHVDFYVTQRIQTDQPNVFCTDDFKIEGGDLNEISYLSRFCDLIVGKNSGPFIYCLTRENLMNPEKKFLAFNHQRVDSLDWSISINCDYEMSTTTDMREVFTIIANKMKAALE